MPQPHDAVVRHARCANGTRGFAFAARIRPLASGTGDAPVVRVVDNAVHGTEESGRCWLVSRPLAERMLVRWADFEWIEAQQ